MGDEATVDRGRNVHRAEGTDARGPYRAGGCEGAGGKNVDSH